MPTNHGLPFASTLTLNLQHVNWWMGPTNRSLFLRGPHNIQAYQLFNMLSILKCFVSVLTPTQFAILLMALDDMSS